MLAVLALAASLVAWLLVALIAVLLLLAVTPLRVKGQFRSEPHRQFKVRAASLNGFLPFLTLFDSTTERAQKRKEKRKLKKKSKPKAKGGKTGGRPGRMSRKMRMGRNIPALILNLINCISFEDITGKIIFGLDDPADTGFVFGLFSPIAYGLPPSKRVHMLVQPVFDRATLGGKADVEFSVTPVTLLPPLVRFGWRSFGPRRASHEN